MLRQASHIAIYHWGHVDWELGAFVLAKMVQSEPTLVPAFLEPHYRGLAEALSQPSPTFYNDGLLFIRLLAQVDPSGLTRVLDEIDVEKAKLGWRNALRGRENNREPGAKTQARQIISLLIPMRLIVMTLWRACATIAARLSQPVRTLSEDY